MFSFIKDKDMVNIISSKTIFDKKEVNEVLSKYIKKDSKICVIAFSQFLYDYTHESYLESYKKETGVWYLHIVEPLLTYGVKEENISFVLYNKDSSKEAKNKINDADIIFLPGGAPDLFMERLKEYDLIDYLKSLDKVFMGPSAGSMIQFDWFHISKDKDYNKFSINEGLGLISGFGVEVHFNRRKQQKKGLRRVSHYNDRPVYVVKETGLMILEDNEIIFRKDVYKYYQKGKRVKEPKIHQW